jgi:hypothetical protein
MALDEFTQQLLLLGLVDPNQGSRRLNYDEYNQVQARAAIRVLTGSVANQCDGK